MHASVSFEKYEGCIMGADVEEPVLISGMAICVVLPSREEIEEITINLEEGGTLVQALPHPPPYQDDGGATVLDKFGFTWYLST